MPSFLSKLFTTPAKQTKVKSFSPEQQALQNRIQSLFGQQYGEGIQGSPTFKAGQDYLTKLLSGSPESFQSFEQPFMQQFQQEIVPQIAERFSGLGAQSSSAFSQALGKAGTDLSSRLANLRGQLQLGSLGPALSYAGAPSNQAIGLLGGSFAPQFSTGVSGARPTGLAELIAALAGGAGQGLGMGFGGLLGNKWFGSSLSNPAQSNPAQGVH